MGIKPHKDYLSEEGARLIARAYKMSRGVSVGLGVSPLNKNFYIFSKLFIIAL